MPATDKRGRGSREGGSCGPRAGLVVRALHKCSGCFLKPQACSNGIACYGSKGLYATIPPGPAYRLIQTPLLNTSLLADLEDEILGGKPLWPQLWLCGTYAWLGRLACLLACLHIHPRHETLEAAWVICVGLMVFAAFCCSVQPELVGDA